MKLPILLLACLLSSTYVRLRSDATPAPASKNVNIHPQVETAPDTATTPPFDAVEAWAEFEQLLRGHYGYFQQPGIDGNAILTFFEPRAKATKTRKEFINVLQVVAYNFADPHFVVGPFDEKDYCIIPTQSDLYAQWLDNQFRIVDVREGSDAERQRIRPGSRIVQIGALTPAQAVEAVMGRPLTSLSPKQVNTGLNIALSGTLNQPRQLTLQADSLRTYTLRPVSELARQIRNSPPLTIDHKGKAAIIRFNNSLGNNNTIAAFRQALTGVMGSQVLILDLRNTPSGGNTTVARSVMGHFVQREKPYQIHVVPSEERQYGVRRKFVEYVLPLAPYYSGKVVVLGGHWTGSMGEGMMIGFDALGFTTAGSGLGDLLGALFNEELAVSGAKVDLGEEQLFHVNGTPREDFRPAIFMEASEGKGVLERVLKKIN